jgi:hypothetical protein
MLPEASNVLNPSPAEVVSVCSDWEAGEGAQASFSTEPDDAEGRDQQAGISHKEVWKLGGFAQQQCVSNLAQCRAVEVSHQHASVGGRRTYRTADARMRTIVSVMFESKFQVTLQRFRDCGIVRARTWFRELRPGELRGNELESFAVRLGPISAENVSLAVDVHAELIGTLVPAEGRSEVSRPSHCGLQKSLWVRPDKLDLKSRMSQPETAIAKTVQQTS